MRLHECTDASMEKTTGFFELFQRISWRKLSTERLPTPRLHQQNQGHLHYTAADCSSAAQRLQTFAVLAAPVEKVYSLHSSVADILQPTIVYCSLP